MSARILLIVVTIFLVLVAAGGIVSSQNSTQVLGQKSEVAGFKPDLSAQIDYWQQVASASPTYRDAWVKLATLYYQEEDITAAKFYMQKAIEIDPNWIVPSSLLPLLP